MKPFIENDPGDPDCMIQQRTILLSYRITFIICLGGLGWTVCSLQLRFAYSLLPQYNAGGLFLVKSVVRHAGEKMESEKGIG